MFKIYLLFISKYLTHYTTVLNEFILLAEPLRFGNLRLANGDQYSGRLEIYDSTRGWGTICTEKFTLESANTACRQLGYARAVQFGEADDLG